MEAKAVAAAVASNKGKLMKLWSYSCPLSQGRAVTGLAWNRVNPDLLAVSYGECKTPAVAQDKDKAPDPAGIVLFWSMSNPSFPQAILHATAGVTSIAFSATHPNLIAAGLQDGSVCIYDVKKVQRRCCTRCGSALSNSRTWLLACFRVVVMTGDLRGERRRARSSCAAAGRLTHGRGVAAAVD